MRHEFEPPHVDQSPSRAVWLRWCSPIVPDSLFSCVSVGGRAFLQLSLPSTRIASATTFQLRYTSVWHYLRRVHPSGDFEHPRSAVQSCPTSRTSHSGEVIRTAFVVIKWEDQHNIATISFLEQALRSYSYFAVAMIYICERNSTLMASPVQLALILCTARPRPVCPIHGRTNFILRCD